MKICQPTNYPVCGYHHVSDFSNYDEQIARLIGIAWVRGGRL